MNVHLAHEDKEDVEGEGGVKRKKRKKKPSTQQPGTQPSAADQVREEMMG